jgi:hypothetical protein
LKEAGNSHRPNATWHRRNGTGNFRRFRIGDVANKARGTRAFGGIIDAVDPDIDHRRAGLYPSALDHLWTAHGWDQNVGRATDRSEVACARVGQRNRAIFGEKQETRRLSDQNRAADHNDMSAGYVA